MTRPFQYLLALACTIAFASQKPPENSPSTSELKQQLAKLSSTIQQLQSDIVQLQKELAHLRFERHRDAIRQIKAELETVHVESERLQESDRARRQDLQDLEEQLGHTEAESTERTDIEWSRNALAVTRAREITEQSEALHLRESELQRRLETEEQAARRIDEAWQFTKGKTR